MLFCYCLLSQVRKFICAFSVGSVIQASWFLQHHGLKTLLESFCHPSAIFCKSEAFGELRRLTTGAELFTRSSAFESLIIFTPYNKKAPIGAFLLLPALAGAQIHLRLLGRICYPSFVVSTAPRAKNSPREFLSPLRDVTALSNPL